VSTLRPVPDAKTTVLLACGHSLVRAGYRAVLESDRLVAIAGEADCGRAAVELARELRPDAIVMDIDIADGDCIETTRELSADPGAPVIVLSSTEDDDRVFDSLRAGANGVLLKDTPPDELLRGLDVATGGEAVLSPSLARRLIAELVSTPVASRPSDDRLVALTAREREVVALVARGLSNEEIAKQLVVSSATARTHVSRSMVKLRARDRAQLVVFAYEGGLLIQPSRP
jgi:DNA-binding NarL/FixJ family response regulator